MTKGEIIAAIEVLSNTIIRVKGNIELVEMIHSKIEKLVEVL